MKPTEQAFWDYIDGTCTAEERQAIARLIETDKHYAEKHEELLIFNAGLEQCDLEEPSMGFTFKVMEGVRAETANVPLKSALNKHIIWGLAGVFTFIILSVLVYALFSINWSDGGAANISVPQVKMPQVSSALTGRFLQAVILINIVLALFFGDSLLRRFKRASHK